MNNSEEEQLDVHGGNAFHLSTELTEEESSAPSGGVVDPQAPPEKVQTPSWWLWISPDRAAMTRGSAPPCTPSPPAAADLVAVVGLQRNQQRRKALSAMRAIDSRTQTSRLAFAAK